MGKIDGLCAISRSDHATGLDCRSFSILRRNRAIVLVALLAGLCVLGLFIVGKMRRGLRESDQGGTDFMTNFREMHSQGELSDEEYRTIKAKLASRLRDQCRTR